MPVVIGNMFFDKRSDKVDYLRPDGNKPDKLERSLRL